MASDAGEGNMAIDGSLFEGMVLFSPSDLLPPPDVSSSPAPSLPPPAPTSQPLDEDLFSDLTLQTPPQPQPMDPAFPTTTPPTPVPVSVDVSSTLQPPSRQTSRKKKRAVRIGYARDAAAAEDPFSLDSLPKPSSSHFSASLPLISSSATSDEAATAIPGAASKLSDYPPDSDQVIDANSFPAIADSGLPPTPYPELIDQCRDFRNKPEEERSQMQEAAAAEVNPSAVGAAAKEDAFDSVEDGWELIRVRISEKLGVLRKRAASLSSEKKELERSRRRAVENLNSASARYKDLEKELEQACETEDFERAERVSERLLTLEKEKDKLLVALRDAEADCESADSKMQEILELQIAAEEEGAAMLEQFAKEATDHAELVLKNADEKSLKELENWQSSMELLDMKKLEMDIELQIISEARSKMKNALENLVEDDTKEKELLIRKGDILAKELDELLDLVRLKEAEIAENKSQLQDVKKRISNVVSGFHEVQSDIDMKHCNLLEAFSFVNSENEALLNKKKEINEFISSEEQRKRKLMEVSTNSFDEAKQYQDLVGLKKCLASTILKSRMDRVRFLKMEEKILEDIQILRQQVSDARITLQELSSARASIQQEVASHKQRRNFVEKRGPELEAEKRVAAAARNFKEAARVAAEAKALNIEKEDLQQKMEKAVLYLEKLDKEIEQNVCQIQESEGLILLKEKEAAMAGYKRLVLLAVGVRAERSAALQMGDLEEGDILLKEAEVAESKARELKEIYSLELEFNEKNYVSLAYITNLEGRYLFDIAASLNLPDANGT